jgi:ribosomal protein S7
MQSESVLICDYSCCSYAIKKKDEIERVAKANR